MDVVIRHVTVRYLVSNAIPTRTPIHISQTSNSYIPDFQSLFRPPSQPLMEYLKHPKDPNKIRDFDLKIPSFVQKRDFGSEISEISSKNRNFHPISMIFLGIPGFSFTKLDFRSEIPGFSFINGILDSKSRDFNQKNGIFKIKKPFTRPPRPPIDTSQGIGLHVWLVPRSTRIEY